MLGDWPGDVAEEPLDGAAGVGRRAWPGVGRLGATRMTSAVRWVRLSCLPCALMWIPSEMAEELAWLVPL